MYINCWTCLHGWSSQSCRLIRLVLFLEKKKKKSRISKSSTFLSVFFDMLLYYTHPKWNRVVLPLCIQVKLILSKYEKAWCSFRKWFLLGFVLAEYILGFDLKYYFSFTFSHLFRPLYWVENTILVTKVKKWKLLSFFFFLARVALKWIG